MFLQVKVLCCRSYGVTVSRALETVEAFRGKCSGEKEPCELVSEALRLWERRAVAGLSGKKTKLLFNNALKFAKGLQRL